MQFLFFRWELKGQEKYCPRKTFSLALLHFFIPKCLMKESNFGTINFSLPSMSEQILHLTIFIFMFGPHIGSNQGNLTTHRS